MQKRRRPLRLLILLLFLLLFAFAFLELNWLRLLYHLRHHSAAQLLPKPPPFISLDEDSGDAITRTNASSHLYVTSPANVPHSTSKRKQSELLLRLLQPNSQSQRFSKRAANFFRGPPPCKDRFLMIWISSLAAFGPRELFAVESLFNSHRNACLLIVSNTMDSVHGALLLKPFSDRGVRVAAASPDFPYLLQATPAAPWFARLRRGEVDPGDVSLAQNLSNLLRLAVLYKYGGVYLDTDVIILRSFAGLRNTIGAQTMHGRTGNWSRLNNAVMVFDKKHPLLYKFMEDFARTFDGNTWGHNGPYLVSRVVARVAGRPGYSFTVLPPPAFYPVDWKKIARLFARPRNRSESRWVSEKISLIRERSYGVHLWNRQSRLLEVEEGSAIDGLMRSCCLLCNFPASGAKVVSSIQLN